MAETKDGVSLREMAALLNMDESQVLRLGRKGVVVRLSPGRYASAASLRNYLRHLREIAATRAASDPSGLNLPDESARLKAAQRRNYELKIERSVVLVSDIQPAWARVVATIRSALFAIPGQLRALVPTMTRQDERVIDRAIKDALRNAGLTDTPPAIEVHDHDPHDPKNAGQIEHGLAYDICPRIKS